MGPNLSSSAAETADLRVIVSHYYGWSLTIYTLRRSSTFEGTCAGSSSWVPMSPVSLKLDEIRVSGGNAVPNSDCQNEFNWDGAGQNIILTILGNGHRGRWAIEQDLADSTCSTCFYGWGVYTICSLGRDQCNCGRTCWVSGGFVWLLATQLSELKCVRIGQDSCCSSGANGFHTAQLLVDWALDLGSLRSWYCPHKPVSQPWLRWCSTFVILCSPLWSSCWCWKVVEPTWIRASWTVAAFQCSVLYKLFQDLSEAACMDTARVKPPTNGLGHGAPWSWRAFPVLLWFYWSPAGTCLAEYLYLFDFQAAFWATDSGCF